MSTKRVLIIAACTMIATSAAAQGIGEFTVEPRISGESYSPFVDQNFPKRVYWGDTHVHTSFSPDAGIVGNEKLGPVEAFRFARGEIVTANNGMRVKLVRPLDFLVVSDHSELMGIVPQLREGAPALLAAELGRRWHQMWQQGDGAGVFSEMRDFVSRNENPLPNEALTRSTWEFMVDTADAFNDPGRFTAFTGYEWTSTPGGRNLHRVVIFRDDGTRTKQVVPFTSFDSEDPEDLWEYMADYEGRTGGNVLAIPHNGNLSNGAMFAVERFDGGEMDADYAEARHRWEPVVEVTQVKGDGEAHPFLSPDDEFADYETWDKVDLFGLVPKEDDMLQHEYARSALKLGLQLEADIGANPFKFGMIGSTDSHTSLATAREDNFFGKISSGEPAPDRWQGEVIRSPVDPSLTTFDWELAASGYAGVWATENTREALFDAFERKEVYATTGSRMLIRVFAGWDFEAEEVVRPDFVEQGYTRGVPMGGDLRGAPEGKAPTFMVRVLRDPDGANLDRVQVVKGWLDNEGALQERVYDIAVSDDRQIGPDGRAREPVGDTVDIANATYTNTIGDPLMLAYWVDPDFDPTVSAFYYVRVIEIPTPRWTAYDAAFFGVSMPDNVPMTTQERAYTSPIWYTPGG